MRTFASLPPGVRARLTPGSARTAFVLFVASEAERAGRGITLAELRASPRAAAITSRTPFATQLSDLTEKGILEARGRSGSLRYSLPGFVETAPTRTDVDVLLDALRAACDRSGTMVPTYLVSLEIERRGEPLVSRDVNFTSSHLKTLAREHRGTRTAPWNRPLVRSVSVANLIGERRAFWAPIERVDLTPPEAAVATEMDAARFCAWRASSEAGRPVTKGEAWLFARTLPPGHVARQFIETAKSRSRLGDLLRRSSLRDGLDDAGQPNGAPHLDSIRTRYYVHGGAPLRYYFVAGRQDSDTVPVGAPTEAGLAALLLDDILLTNELDVEAGGLVKLRESLEPSDADALAPWLTAREASSREVYARHALTFHSRDVIQAAAAVADGADTYFARLAQMVPEGYDEASYDRFHAIRVRQSRRRRLAEALTSQLDAAARDSVGRRQRPPDYGVYDGEIVGSPGTSIAVADVVPWVRQYVDVERGLAGLYFVLRPCRRFRDIDAHLARKDRTVLRALTGIQSVHDRAEVLVTLMRLQEDAWSSVMVRKSYLLLGPLCRDREAFDRAADAVFCRSGISRTTIRRTLLASGLLGRTRTLDGAREIALRADDSREGELDVRSALLSVALADPDRLTNWLEALPDLHEHHQERVTRARRRARMGLVLSIAAPVAGRR